MEQATGGGWWKCFARHRLGGGEKPRGMEGHGRGAKVSFWGRKSRLFYGPEVYEDPFPGISAQHCRSVVIESLKYESIYDP